MTTWLQRCSFDVCDVVVFENVFIFKNVHLIGIVQQHWKLLGWVEAFTVHSENMHTAGP